MARYPELNVGVVLDNDVGGDIGVIINKCKNPVFVRLTAEGVPAHGSTPWDGLDANEMLMRTIAGLRRFYPYFDINSGKPANTWIDTMHAARISGGDVSNIISGRAEALLDIRLTETSTVEDLAKNLREACAPGVSYEIVSASTPVVMSEDNPQILAYKRLAEQVTGRKIVFEQIGGATDALFAEKGATVIMHSGTGEGMHADGEYVVWQSVEELARIQIEYLEKSGECLKGEIPGSGKGRKRRQNRCFPLCGRWRRKLWKKRKSPAFPAKGWHLPRRHLIYRNLLRFGSRAASSKIAAFTELRWLRY